MKHLQSITAPRIAEDLNSVYWIVVNFFNAGVALLGTFAAIYETTSYNLGEKKAE